MTFWFEFDVFKCLYEAVVITKTIHTAGISFFSMYEHFNTTLWSYPKQMQREMK